jgi:hypothetical protein
LDKKNNIKYKLTLSYWVLARVVGYLYDDDKLIISAYDSNKKSMKTRTFFINLDIPDEQYEIQIDDKKYSPYKCVFDSLTNELYFTHRKSNDFEDREIMCTSDYHFTKLLNPIVKIEK